MRTQARTAGEIVANHNYRSTRLAFLQAFSRPAYVPLSTGTEPNTKRFRVHTRTRSHLL